MPLRFREKIQKMPRKIGKLRLKQISLAVLSGILLILSFPDFNIRLLAWISFIPLFFAIKGSSKGGAFILACFTGLVFWSGAIYWLIHVTLAGTILLVLYLSLYFGIFGLIFNLSSPLSPGRRMFLIPSAWVTLEYLRAHLLTGFPWALLGYSQYFNLKVIQVSDVTGCWGVSFLLMLVNFSAYLPFSKKEPSAAALKRLAVTLLLLIFVLGYGVYRLHQKPKSFMDQRSLRVVVVQADIPQELKWARGSEDYIVSRYEELTRDALKLDPGLIIWPEAASPYLLGKDDAEFSRIFLFAKEIKKPLLLGAVVVEKEDYFNSAILLDWQGRITGRYDKLHLVPFGEYIPLKKLFPFLETVVPIGDITRGKEYNILEIPDAKSPANYKFAVLICFEDLFPELSREFRREGAEFLVNITNDAWYKKTCAPYQHLQASVFRAVENRSFLVRSANTGVSAFITPQGRIASTVKGMSGKEIFVPGYASFNLPIEEEPLSFYTRYGDIFMMLCFLLTAYFLAFLIRGR